MAVASGNGTRRCVRPKKAAPTTGPSGKGMVGVGGFVPIEGDDFESKLD